MIAIKDGATLLLGGDRPPHLKKGHYIAPTVLGDVTETMGVYRQETFGPIVSMRRKNRDRADMTTSPRRSSMRRERVSPPRGFGSKLPVALREASRRTTEDTETLGLRARGIGGQPV